VGIVAGIITVFVEDTNFIRYALAAYYGLAAICLMGLLAGMKFVKPFYLIHDIVCGHIIFVPLFFLGAIQFPRHIQTWLLYHNALSSDVVVSDILRYARKNQDSGTSNHDEDLIEQVAELKKIVQKQEQMLTSAGLMATDNVSTPTATNAMANLFAAPDEASVQAGIRTVASDVAKSTYGRALSMSGLDVWSSMAVGSDFGAASSADHPQMPMFDPDMQPRNMGSLNVNQDFSFSQPDTMPPR
jgi:callose synthase